MTCNDTHTHCHSCWCKLFEWIRIEWIRIAWIRIGGIRVGGIRFEWICVGYVWCDGYVWDMCGVRYANNLLKNPATKRLSGKKNNWKKFAESNLFQGGVCSTTWLLVCWLKTIPKRLETSAAVSCKMHGWTLVRLRLLVPRSEYIWTRMLSQVWTCVRYAPKHAIP